MGTVKSPDEASLSSSRCEERGALDLIAQAGGGVVEAYPQDTEGKKVSASFLYNDTPHTLRVGRLPLRQAEGQEPHGDEDGGGG